MLMKLGLPGACAGERGGPSSPYLDGILSSVVADLDATIAASYGGSGQVWYNLTAAPADGAAQSGYNFILGSSEGNSTADPTYNGSGASAYFLVNGSSWFTLQGAQPTFMAKLHRSNSVVPFWMCLCFRIPGSIGGTDRFLGNSSSASHGGVQLQRTSGGALSFILTGDGTTNSFAPSYSVTTNNDYLALFSYDPQTGAYRTWLNQRTAGSSGTITPTSKTSDSAGIFSIGSANNGSLPVDSGTRFYAFSLGNEFLDDTKAGVLIDHMNARHERVYA